MTWRGHTTVCPRSPAASHHTPRSNRWTFLSTSPVSRNSPEYPKMSHVIMSRCGKTIIRHFLIGRYNMQGKMRLMASGAALVCAVALGMTFGEAFAEVQLNINLGPPPVVVSEPPSVVLVPGTGVYFLPDVNFDVFFFGGYWWSPRGDRWYRAPAYNGPWSGVSRRVVPAPVFRVPHDYRRVYYRERHIPYGQWKQERREHGRGRERGEGRGEGHGGGPGRHGDGEHRDRGEHGERGEHGGGR